MIVVDIETSGVDPRMHSIISIGAVELENPDNEFYGECAVWDGAEILDEALEINGFTREDITDPSKQTLEILMIGFLDWVRNLPNHTLAGHNLGDFDVPFLKDSARRYHLDFFLPKRTIDTHTLTYMHMIKKGLVPPVEKGRSAINSHFVQSYVGIKEVPLPHNALTDARWTAEAISRLLYDKNLLDEYKDFSIPWISGRLE
jgi:DNA polymerase III epsilon subunit-like protein